jgi:hypothetical protein
LSSVDITFSTTTKSGSQLSESDLDQNIGADAVLSASGARTFPGFTWGGAATSPFAIRIPLDQPFLHRPASGSLLIDIKITSTDQFQGYLVDFVRASSAGVGSFLLMKGGFGEPAGFAGGLVMEIGYTPVPEPSLFGLSLIAVVGLTTRRMMQGTYHQGKLTTDAELIYPVS